MSRVQGWLAKHGVPLSDRAYQWGKKIAGIAAGVAGAGYLYSFAIGIVVQKPVSDSRRAVMAHVDSVEARVTAKVDAVSKKVDTALQGLDLITQVILDGGVYTRKDIDSFRATAEAQHRQTARDAQEQLADSARALREYIRTELHGRRR